MKTVLFFQSTTRKSWMQKLSGVHRFAQDRDWFVQVIERFASASNIRRALRTWAPIGCFWIAQCERQAHQTPSSGESRPSISTKTPSCRRRNIRAFCTIPPHLPLWLQRSFCGATANRTPISARARTYTGTRRALDVSRPIRLQSGNIS